MAKKKLIYIILRAPTIKNLEDDVMNCIERDWKLQGGVACGRVDEYCQAMVKYIDV